MGRTKRDLSIRRHWRVRRKILGTAERPRFSVKFTGQHIHVQFIDDKAGVTLASVSTEQAQAREAKVKADLSGAAALGKIAAERALNSNIQTVVFDRGSRKYHGKIKALAEAARQAGLKF